MANLVCFFAARAARRRLGRARRRRERRRRPRLRAYGSAETHTWIQKAADLSGIGTARSAGFPPTTISAWMSAALREQIAADRAAGDLPFIVVGTAGSVSTGAVDPLPAIAAFCREQRGCGFTSTAPTAGSRRRCRTRRTICGRSSRADSVAVDPHKWLYAPLEAGCALVRDADALRRAFAYHPPYYHFDEQATNFVDFGLQNSRGFRALKVWLALRQAGASGYRRMISDDIALSRAMAEASVATPDLELVHAGAEHHDVPLRAAELRGRAWTSHARRGISTR